MAAENESTDPLHPTIAGRYAYSPYGEAHVESAPELLRAHIDGDVASANGTPQAISDPRVAASGALLLDWSAALDGTTLAAGVALETQVGGVWTALTGAEVVIAQDNSATKLTILPIHGWAASTSYRVRLTPSLHDTLGRTLAANETLELRTAAAPATGVMPAVPFDRKTALSYESWRAANDTLGNRFPGGQSHLFQGAWTDPVIGLAYHRARWYEARNAVWLSEDPAGTVDSVNLQAFVGWGPQGKIDSLGLQAPGPKKQPWYEQAADAVIGAVVETVDFFLDPFFKTKSEGKEGLLTLRRTSESFDASAGRRDPFLQSLIDESEGVQQPARLGGDRPERVSEVLRGGAETLEHGGKAAGYATESAANLSLAGAALGRQIPRLPVGVGGTGAAYDKVAGQGLYVLKDASGKVLYVGRGDAPARLVAHASTVDKGALTGRLLWENNLTAAEAKGLEQRLMNHFGGAKSVDPLTNLLNKIRSFSPFNPRASEYENSVTEELWQETLNRLGE